MNKMKLMKAVSALTGAGMAVSMGTLTAFAADTATTADTASGGSSALGVFAQLGLPILLLVFLYFIMVRPQQKQEKETREMQKNLQVGDEVVSIGGIVGIVVRVEEKTETVVLETGSDRLKIRLKMDAIRENITAAEQAAAAKAEKDKKKAQQAGAITSGKPKDE